LLVRYDGVGDTLVTAPLLAALLEAGHEVGIVSRQAHVGIFRPDLVRAHGVTDIEHPHSILEDVKARAYDVALIATEKPYGYTLAKLAGIPKRVGFWNGIEKPFKGFWVRSLCTDIRLRGIAFKRRHEVEIVFTLGQGLHSETKPTQDVERLRHLFTRNQKPRQNTLTVQITPKWLIDDAFEPFLVYLKQLARHAELRLIGAASEDAFLAEVEQRSGIGIERHRDIGSWIERIAFSRTLLTPDTGAAHVAGMTGTPVIDIFPSSANAAFRARWRPWASPAALMTARKLFRQDPATLSEAVQ
jgi:ADP-heptose:LPS heptosyltransferase